jgi:hypothetical protein
MISPDAHIDVLIILAIVVLIGLLVWKAFR